MHKLSDEADQRVVLGIAVRVPVADLLQHPRLHAGELGEKVVSGDAVVAARDVADDELDDLLIALGQAALGDQASSVLIMQ